MANKRKAKTKALGFSGAIKKTATGNNRNTLQVTAAEGTSKETTRARVAYDPAARSLAASRMYIKNLMGEQALTESLETLNAQIKVVQSGNLGEAEKTLVAQANTLDAIFNELARRAALNMSEYLGAAETYLRLALKAQSQCRATLETLAEIKNPMTGAYVRQANIAAGHQQVNNGTPQAGEASRARENENPSNKLLEATHGERLDRATPSEAGTAHSQVEAVGTIHRTQNGGG